MSDSSNAAAVKPESFSGPDRRRHRVYVTKNTEYHFRDGFCVAVRDRRRQHRHQHKQPAAGTRQQPEPPPTERVTTHCDPFNPARTDSSENIRIWQNVSFPCCGWPEFGERLRPDAGQAPE